jgi:predicted permease
MSIFQDVRYALRLLVKSRVSTTVAVLSLALGIGATTAIFSVVYAVLVDPYPYVGADRIGGAHLISRKGDQGTDYTMAEYLEMKAGAKSVEGMILNNRRSVVLTEAGLPEAVIQEDFSPNAFEFFGVPPLFGRTFSPPDTGDESKAESVAVLSYLFWQRHFSGRHDILGQQIRLNDKFFTVIGVLPVRFTWNDADVYVPVEIHPSAEERFGMVLKVKPGIPREQVNAEFQTFHEKFSKTAPSYLYPEPPFRTEFKSVNEGILGKFANTLLALLAAVGFLLLIACANVANLLLARASARQGEIAVRVALGAGRRRLIQQLLTESVILSAAGGALGVALAYGGVRAVVALMPEYSVPHEAVIAINVPVLYFAVTVSVLTGILFGLAPALQLSSRNQAGFLKAAGRDSDAGAPGHRLRDALIVFEVTISIVLLTGAALAAAGMLELTKQKLGYQPKGVLTIYVFAPPAHYRQWSQRRAFFTEIIERLGKLPGAESAAATLTGVPPYSGAPSNFAIDGLPSPGTRIRVNLVSDAYFSTLGIPLLKGRYLDAADVTRVNPVAVVTEDLVQKYFPAGQDPIGRQISLDLFTGALPANFIKSPQDPHVFQIVGVCGTARNSGLRDAPEPAVYLPFSSILSPGMMFAIRTTKPDALALSNGARQAVSAVDPSQPITFVVAWKIC